MGKDASRSWRYWLASLLVCWVLQASLGAQVSIVVQGNAVANLTSSLTNLGRTYTLASGSSFPDPSSYDLGAGDILILGYDGSTPGNFNYTPFLNAGGHLIVAGGSSDTSFRAWAATYFNTTDTSGGWHTDGAWTNLAVGQAITSGMPASFTFANNNATYHMLGFLPTPNTVLYGQNAEPNYISAIRYYDNGGSFNYMAMLIGSSAYVTGGDVNAFVQPWLAAALAIPEPSTYALFGTGLAALALRAWRRRR